jgi:hypothetical protein
MKLSSIKLLILMLILSSCATAPPQRENSRFRDASPRSILIVPVINRSVDISAPDYLLSTMTIPLAEKGYYVFPVNMVKRVLEDDGLSDANLVHSAPAERLGSLFGADSILYVTIESWDAKYYVIGTTVTLQLLYTIKDGRSGATLWQRRQRVIRQSQNTSSGNAIADLVAMTVSAAVSKMAPDYIGLAREANARAFAYPGAGIPPGPYALDVAGKTGK